MHHTHVRVQIQELVTHTFLLLVPTDDSAAIKDAAFSVFELAANPEELESYDRSVTLRQFLNAEPLPEASFDNGQAEDEGWSIFDANSLPTLQRLDEDAVFKSDEDAWRFVSHRADKGSAYHISALAFLKLWNPPAWRDVVAQDS